MKFGKYTVDLSNPEKVLFPERGFTKKDLVDHYLECAPVMLPHIQDRPLAMHRFPDGIGETDFFQKNVPDYFHDWIPRIRIQRESGTPIHMLTANNRATLAYLANQACIAPHIWLSRSDELDHPDKMIFDLDPPEDGFGLVVEAAKNLRKLIEEEKGMTSFVMTTGSKGLHVVVPIRRGHSFDEVRKVARKWSGRLAQQWPEKFTTEQRKDKREGRVFLDYLRNAYGQHSIAPYGVRALPGAPVATPLHWEELDHLPENSQTFSLSNIPERLRNEGDPWKGMMRHAAGLK